MTTNINFEIGDPKAQSKFREEHQEFIECFPTLTVAIEKAFNRISENYSIVDALIYDLSKECVNRFSEIGLLCTKGLGDGAYVMLRSMFEYLVNARYLHLHPDKANDFVEYLSVYMRTVKNQIDRIFGDSYLPSEYKEMVEKNFNKVKEKFTHITERGGERVQPRWTKPGIVDMAIDVGLSEFVVVAHYLSIEKAHPSILFILSSKDQREKNASDALMVSHKMMIELLILQHQHFGIDELKPLIDRCVQDFKVVWKKYKTD